MSPPAPPLYRDDVVIHNRDIPKATKAARKVTSINARMRRIPMPAIARTGRAKKGWIMLPTDSPIATAIVVRGSDARRARAAGKTNGPCTAQWPPPLGMKNVMITEEIYVQNGSVLAVASLRNPVEIMAAKPVAVMIPMIPPYRGYRRMRGPVIRAAFLTAST